MAAEDVALPKQGTTEYNLNGTISFESDSTWRVNGRWAPFASPNLQWGIDLTVFDTPTISPSGFVGALVNWHFVPTSGQTLPYVGAGIGTAFGDASGTTWNVHAGIKYFVNSAVAFTAEFQHIKLGNAGTANQIVFGFSLFR